MKLKPLTLSKFRCNGMHYVRDRGFSVSKK